MATYRDRTVKADLFLSVTITIPNTKPRQRAIPLHDLHHVATGYGTDLVGEAEIAAWELVGGCTSFIVYWLNGSALLLGLVLSPLRVLRALRHARGQRTLYRDPLPYDELVDMTVGDPRTRLGIPREGQADRAARLHASPKA
jgi:hypothetical protein